MGKYLDQYIKDITFEANTESGINQMIASELLILAEAIQADLAQSPTNRKDERSIQ